MRPNLHGKAVKDTEAASDSIINSAEFLSAICCKPGNDLETDMALKQALPQNLRISPENSTFPHSVHSRINSKKK